MGQMKDYTGLRFGRLTVLKRASKKGSHGESYWECQCDCGNKKTVAMSALNHGYTKSCGCLRRELLQNDRYKDKHLYQAWQDMKQRCHNPNNVFYYRYGERGIKVCKEWLSGYNVFYKWATNNGYQQGLQIDRIDNNGNYEPSNCRWVSPKQNTDNRNITRMLTYNGKTQTIADWSRETGIPITTIRNRIAKGASGDELFSSRQRPPIMIEYHGEKKSLVEWCKELNIPYDRTKARYYAGKNVDEVLKQ